MSHTSLTPPIPSPRAVNRPDREQVDHSIKFLKKTIHQMRRATRKNDPFPRPATAPALTPFVRDQVESAIQHLKEAAIDYGLAKDRAVKTKGYITSQSMAVLYESERKLHAAARNYSQLFRFTQPPEVIHTRE